MNDHDPNMEFEERLRSLTPRPLSDGSARSIHELIADTPPRHRLRAWWAFAPLAAAACLGLAFMLIPPGSNTIINHHADKTDQAVSAPAITLAHWRVQPTGDANYTVLAPDRVRLDRGELLVESEQSDTPALDKHELTIETPDGRALAQGTLFYIGTHASNPKGPDMKRLTRVLILAGTVTLTNTLGSITGGPNDLLAAEPDQAPAKVAAQANTDFAIDLYHQLAKENEGKNLFFSPYSISNALAMTMEGARGQTMKEMGTVLRLPDAAQRTGDDAQELPWQTSLIHTGFGRLNEQFNKEDKPYKLSVANALWGEKSFDIRNHFVKTIDDAYGTGAVTPMNFRGDADGSRKHINVWVEKQTNERIKDLLPEGTIDRDTRLVLTNAIYFKGDWKNKFDKSETADREFTLVNGSTAQAPTMYASDMPGRLGAVKINEKSEYPNTYLLELPYKGDELSMLLIVGDEQTPLSAIENKLTSKNLAQWVGTLRDEEEIGVLLPKFKAESEYQLQSTLAAMGMPTAFIERESDFSGISESFGKQLNIGAVIHKGFVEVNEEGTEAAAATAITIKPNSIGPMFHATKPFIYMIRDNKTGTILFMGRMMDPSAK